MSVTSGTSNKNRLKMGAGFVGGGPSPILNPRNISTSGYSGSPRYSADSMFSIYTGAKKALEEIDEEDEEMKEVDKTLFVESKIRKIFKNQLRIHEKEIQEAAQLIRLVPAAITAYNVYNSIDEDEDENNEENDIEEMSTVAGSLGGGGTYTGPLAGSEHDLEKMRNLGFGG
tara:strand:- start:1900 stop:2415 length:516 start_codon:yes stop_codon:yes gene_type:complete